MGYNVSSTQERIIRGIVKGLGSRISIPHNPEVDFMSQTLSQPKTFPVPEYNIRLQNLPDIRRVPILKIRCNISVGITRTFGSTPYEQDVKVNAARDEIIEWFQKHATSVLKVRICSLINADTSVRGELYVSLIQFEFVVFQQKGEY